MILGTAGHIDHGKTTLVHALTGVDTDRLPDEKRRGITIELGFAPLHLDDVGIIGVVDVPGHEAFVRTMLAGATGIDLALLVVAADEGMMPQTREHLVILELLGVRAGVVALTKADLADPEWMQLVEEDVRSAVARGPLAAAPIVRCSATTGAGMSELRSAIRAAALRVPVRSEDDLFRMPIDRVFSVKGTGTVVTGTVWSGRLKPEQAVAVKPGPRTARVRGIEAHGASTPTATSGMRAAIALAGVDRAEIDAHGLTLVCADDSWVESRVLRADVAMLADAPVLGPRTRVRLHVGTADVGARLVAVGQPVGPGMHVPVRIALDLPVVSRAGDRFVIRSPSPSATIGGGVITDPAPTGRRIRPWPEVGASPEARLAWLVTEAAGFGLEIPALAIRLGALPSAVRSMLATASEWLAIGDRLFASTLYAHVMHAIADAVARAHREHPLDAGIPMQSLRSQIRVASALVDHAVAELCRRSSLSVTDGLVAQVGWAPGGSAADQAKLAALLAALASAGRQPPDVAELEVQFGAGTLPLLKLLTKQGLAVAVASDRYFAADALGQLISDVRVHLEVAGNATASQLRDATGLTRKFLIPVLEYLDRIGVTVRRGDVRMLAPKR